MKLTDFKIGDEITRLKSFHNLITGKQDKKWIGKKVKVIALNLNYAIIRETSIFGVNDTKINKDQNSFSGWDYYDESKRKEEPLSFDECKAPEEYPEEFKDFKKGDWIINNHNEIACIVDGAIYVNNSKCTFTGYGICILGWSDLSTWHSNTKSWRKAEVTEVYKAFKKEVEKRYKDKAVKCLLDGGIYKDIDISYPYKPSTIIVNRQLFMKTEDGECVMVFNNGKWADTAEEMFFNHRITYPDDAHINIGCKTFHVSYLNNVLNDLNLLNNNYTIWDIKRELKKILK